MENDPSELQVISVSEISANLQQPRKDFSESELTDLSASIAEKGIIQPLVVRQVASGFELIAGERRLRAAIMAGFSEVPVRIMEVANENEMLELSLIENLQRHDLNPVELARGYYNLYHRWELSQEKIAQRVGKDRATIANMLRILELPENVLTSLQKNEITTGHAKAILSLDGPSRQSAMWKRITQDNLSVRQTEQIVREIKNRTSSSKPKPQKEQNPVLLNYTDKIRQALGTQVKIAKRGKKGSIRIEFYSEDELERLVQMLSNVGDKW